MNIEQGKTFYVVNFLNSIEKGYCIELNEAIITSVGSYQILYSMANEKKQAISLSRFRENPPLFVSTIFTDKFYFENLFLAEQFIESAIPFLEKAIYEMLESLKSVALASRLEFITSSGLSPDLVFQNTAVFNEIFEANKHLHEGYTFYENLFFRFTDCRTVYVASSSGLFKTLDDEEFNHFKEILYYKETLNLDNLSENEKVVHAKYFCDYEEISDPELDHSDEYFISDGSLKYIDFEEMTDTPRYNLLVKYDEHFVENWNKGVDELFAWCLSLLNKEIQDKENMLFRLKDNSLYSLMEQKFFDQ